MSGLLESTIGAVGQVGESLDKITGGRALRGTLAGKPRELASVIPLSDTMGLTDEKDKTSGRDLTDAYGFTKKGDDSFGSHAAGFLADTVASPLSLLGGYGAFKAAPTLAKGIVAGGKALTGLDAVEHLASGAKGLASKAARFGSEEAGSLKAFAPKPVDLPSLHSESLSANATRPRRWSEVPAERAYYAGDRNRRYAQRMTGREIPRDSGPAGVPAFGLGHFLNDERGSLDMGSFTGRKPFVPNSAPAVPAFDETANHLGKSAAGGGKEVRRYLDPSTLPSAVDPSHLSTKMRAASLAADEYRRGSHGANALLRRTEPGQLASKIGELRDAYNPEHTIAWDAAGDLKPSHVVPGLMDLLEHSRLPNDMGLYRGVDSRGVKKIEEMLGVPLSSPEAVGREFMDPAFLSTSQDHRVANAFAHISANADPYPGATFHFPNVPKGKQGIMFNPGESEVLFPPGRRIRIDDNSDPRNIKATLYSSILAAMMAGGATTQMGANNGGA